ncbi:S1 family peptidase [Saccharopolyspora griseoalba]|uniref:S1 family peptidase n=1 Tax=Saccharopolyspora griseoalba TaxID=1431848 RepID=A0ABW2LJC5_9PSEU
MTSRLAARIAGTVLATAGTVAALTMPAGATQQAQEPSGTMLAAMQRDLGLTAGQAQARIARDTAASRTARALEDKLAGAYGGSYIDQATGELVVGVTDAARADAVRAAGARIEQVAFSEDRLDGAVAALNAAQRQAPGAVTGWYVDPQQNSVVMTVKPGGVAEATEFARTSGDAAAIEVVESAAQPRTFMDVVGGNAYTIDNSARCSVGFSVDGGFVSAGHCGQTGSSTSNPSGTFAGSSFPGDDYSYIETGSDDSPQPYVNTYDGGQQAVSGSSEAAVGASICRSGSTTGWHCGTVQAKNQTVRYAEGTVSGLTQTDVCAEPGDSGGSFISGDQAQGMTSGGSGDCTRGGTTYFQPVNEALSAYGVNLVTQ